jgi:hypothetical protein
LSPGPELPGPPPTLFCPGLHWVSPGPGGAARAGAAAPSTNTDAAATAAPNVLILPMSRLAFYGSPDVETGPTGHSLIERSARSVIRPRLLGSRLGNNHSIDTVIAVRPTHRQGETSRCLTSGCIWSQSRPHRRPHRTTIRKQMPSSLVKASGGITQRAGSNHFGPVLLRVSRLLTPTQAAGYQKALSSVV